MTVQEIINAALRMIGVIASGETPSATESNDSLTVANTILGSWSAQALPIYQITRDVIPVTGASSYVMAVRPIKVKGALLTNGGVATPMIPVSAEEWTGGGGTAAEPYMWCDGGYPTSTLWLRPAPMMGTLEVYSYRPLTTFAALTDNVTLPPGYDRALITNLAVELAPQFGRAIDAALMSLAVDAKNSVQGLNMAVLGAAQPVATQAATPAPAPTMKQ